MSACSEPLEFVMRAVITPKYGSPDVLQFVERSEPEPAQGELLIDVHAVAVTRGDDRVRSADFPGFTALIGRAIFGFLRPRKQVQGTMFAGRVAAVGPGVERFVPGDRVFGEVANGAFAERLVIGEDAGVTHLPEGLSYSDVAALPYGAVTAWVFLNDIAAVQPGEHVVVVGAGGGVGRYAVQIAKHLGARVTAVAGARNDALLRRLDVDAIVRPEHATAIRPDVVLDTSGRHTFADWRDRLPQTGRFLTVDFSLRLLLDLMLAPFRRGPKVHTGIGNVTAETLRIIADLLRSGALTPAVARSFKFEDMVAAHRYVRTGDKPGDVVCVTRTAA